MGIQERRNAERLKRDARVLAAPPGSAELVDLPVIDEPRGRLMPFDFADLPFEPRRFFLVDGAPAGERRGGHGHRTCAQLLVCLRGSVQVSCRMSDGARTFRLANDGRGLLIGPQVVSSQIYDEPGGLLLVVASEPYDPASYIRAAE